MLKIRTPNVRDIAYLRYIHERDYPKLEFPDFLNLASTFIIDSDGTPIMGGGVELQGEALLITDKRANPIKIGRALIEAQRHCLFTCGRLNLRELNAFVTDDEYASHLKKHGFEEREEKVLRMKMHG